MDSKTGTDACCVQVAREKTERPVAVKREAAPVPTVEAGPALSSARAAQSRCHGNLARYGELFEPVALMPVKDEEAVIASANDSDFGLGGSVFTRDVARVNNLDLADAYLPFGGVKTSGHGGKLSRMDIQQFANKKRVRTSLAETRLCGVCQDIPKPDEIAGERP